ncbi:MAG: SET domain-containing protein-lysine N-methyltransferase [Chitinophagaceae bacterium]|nr:MAG: SET domain-containing protein-lysine N-methyltransferase [Chitinophagaceae bacterium]
MQTKSIINNKFELMSHHASVQVMRHKTTHQNLLLASISFSPGDVISKFTAATTQSFATYLTVQTGVDTHITLWPEFLQYINHSCEPNVFFDTHTMELICLKPVKAGDELCFFYPSAEWEMAQPFLCNCGSRHCLQLINGASHVSNETLGRYRLTDFIQGQVNQRRPL